MKDNQENYKKIYEFLVNNKNKLFTVEEIKEKSGIAITTKTLAKYINEKLINKCIFDTKTEKNKKKIYEVKFKFKLSYEDFYKIIGQTNIIHKNKEEIIVEKLKSKSLETFQLALEIFNRPQITNKVEIFSILIINAWELMLKGILIKNNNYNLEVIHYKNDTEKLTKDVSKIIIEYYFEAENETIKKNLDFIIGLRDKSVHYFIDELETSLLPNFQATIYNYIKEYENNFESIGFLEHNFGILLPTIRNIDFSLIKSKYNQEISEEIKNFLNNLETEQKKYDDFFSVKHDFSAILTKHNERADIKLYKGEGDNLEPLKILQVPRDINETHPYLFKDLVAHMKTKNERFSQYILHQMIKKYDIKNHPEWCYIIDNKTSKIYKYSKSLMKKLEDCVHNFL